MHICYIDEAGCTSVLPAHHPTVQPALVIAALFLDQTRLVPVTRDFLALKRQFFPGLCGLRHHELEDMRVEIKGSVLRKEIRESRKLRRHHFGFIDGVLDVIENNGARITAHIWIKAIGQPLNGTAVYTTSVQATCGHFQNYLEEQTETGLLVADFRTPSLNSDVSHSIFTQKYKATGDAFGRILEMPTFGHSHNHAGIQIADILCSTLLFPIATHTYCAGYLLNSVHVNTKDNLIKSRYAPRLRVLQYRYYKNNSWRGGISVDDKLQHRRSHLMVN